MKNRKICIVGYGEHVRRTIIPSLNIKSEDLKIITKKKIKFCETFSQIKTALKILPKDYIFFNSTPPRVHYSTSKLILNSGFNLIVEKPLCVNLNQLNQLYQIAKKKKVFVFESMMYFYSKQFSLFKRLVTRKNIDKININFSIPRIRKKTFRSEKNLESSILFDMGCYPISLISYFKFNSNNCEVSYKKKNKTLSFLKINFLSRKIKFNIIIAIYRKYKNFVKIYFKNNTIYHLDHFFYGKKIQKINVLKSVNDNVNLSKINEENLFKILFNFSNKKLTRLSKSQYLITKRYLKSLNQIKKKLNYSSN